MTAALVLAALPALADIDMQLNTSNFVAGQASTLSVDGIITDGGDSFSILAGCIELRFDPSKVTISNLHTDSATTWTVMASNMDHTADGWLRVIVYNTCDYGQTEDGPMLLFTVTPVDSTVDVNDCGTLRMSAEDSDLCDTACYDYQPTDACAAGGRAAMQGESPADSPAGSTLQGPTDCQPDLPDAILALQVTGGLGDSQTDFAALDKDGDGAVTLADVLLLLRPCMAEPLGWYTLQGNCRRTGRLNAAIPDNPSQLWSASLPRANATFVDPADRGSELQPSVVAVPNPDSPASWPVLFAAVNDVASTGYPGDGYYMASKLYRIEDQGTSYSTPSSGQWVFTNAVGSPIVANGFIATGIMAVKNMVIVAGNEYAGYTSSSAHCHVYAFDAAHISNGPVWDRRMPGAIYGSPAYSPIATTYQLKDASNNLVNASNNDGAVLVSFFAADGSHSYMLALNVTNGRNCWGAVYGYSNSLTGAVQGDLVPNVNGTLGGLPPLAGNATESSPSRDDYSAYVGNSAGLLDVRDLITGAVVAGPDFGGSTWLGGHPVQSSPALFEDMVYLDTSNYGFLASGLITNEGGVRGGTALWRYSTGLHPAYATPAFWREGRTTFLPDTQGDIAGVGTDNYPQSPGHPLPKWSPANVLTDNSEAVYASPLVAGSPRSSTARVFVATDDKVVDQTYIGARVNVLDAATGNQAYASIGPLNGKVRASLAAYKPANSTTARLYVLSMGTSTDVVPRLYCFGG